MSGASITSTRRCRTGTVTRPLDPGDPTGPPTSWSFTLTQAITAHHLENAAQVDQLDAAATWVDLNTPDPDQPSLPAVTIAGPGAPTITATALIDYATALHATTDWAARLLGDATDLRHRLPNLNAAVHAGHVPVWKARRIATATRTLPTDTTTLIDTHLPAYAPTLTRAGLTRLIATTLAVHHPDLAAARDHATRDTRHATLTLHDTPTSDTSADPTATLTARLDLIDALDLDHAITHTAHHLHHLGSTLPDNALRAAALAELARTTLPLPLHTTTSDTADHADSHHPCGCAHQPTPPDTSPDPGQSPPAGPPHRQPGHDAAAFTRPHPRVEPGAEPDPCPCGTVIAGRHARVYIHLTHDALTDPRHPGIARVDTTRGVRVLTLNAVREWLSATPNTTITITPVIDLTTAIRVDQYEIPDRLARLVRARDGRCVFPYCTRPARPHHDTGHTPDIDHIRPYRPGHPGQTSTTNLAPLCRRHHRAKTFTTWTYRLLHPGAYLWTNPHGHHWLVDPAGTHTLTPPPPPPERALPIAIQQWANTMTTTHPDHHTSTGGQTNDNNHPSRGNPDNNNQTDENPGRTGHRRHQP